MDNIKIVQILKEEWTDDSGKIRTNVLGLGDDNKIYRWHLGTATWLLYVINK